jgi:hypothetical protein
MSVSNLETPEKGLNLQNREARGAKKAPAEAELEGLRERIAAAREIKPEVGFCCSHCAQAFTAGRDAAIKAIEG